MLKKIRKRTDSNQFPTNNLFVPLVFQPNVPVLYLTRTRNDSKGLGTKITKEGQGGR